MPLLDPRNFIGVETEGVSWDFDTLCRSRITTTLTSRLTESQHMKIAIELDAGGYSGTATQTATTLASTKQCLGLKTALLAG